MNDPKEQELIEAAVALRTDGYGPERGSLDRFYAARDAVIGDRLQREFPGWRQQLETLYGRKERARKDYLALKSKLIAAGIDVLKIENELGAKGDAADE